MTRLGVSGCVTFTPAWSVTSSDSATRVRLPAGPVDTPLSPVSTVPNVALRLRNPRHDMKGVVG
jgi:hypothetical protein